jgi:hypothetical protein
VALLLVFIGACVGCTCVSSWSGRPVWWADAAGCAAWAWWRCTVGDAASDGGRWDADGGLSSTVICAYCISVRGR